MTQDNSPELLTEDRRKEIFLALVEAQDQKIAVPKSRKMVVDRFGVSEGQVRVIE